MTIAWPFGIMGSARTPRRRPADVPAKRASVASQAPLLATCSPKAPGLVSAGTRKCGVFTRGTG